MHEMGIMTNVLDMALEYSKGNNVKRIQKINLEVGEYSGIIPKIAQDFFTFLAKDTIAAGAVIEIKKVPLKYICYECGKLNTAIPGKTTFLCSECGSDDIQFLSSGREWRMESMEVE